MTNQQWRTVLTIARRVLGKGENVAWGSESWCAWTTFSSLHDVVNYWHRGVPDEEELLEEGTQDGGLWMQSFRYNDIAHFIVPAQFRWERVDNGIFQEGIRTQNISKLSEEVKAVGIAHRLTNLVFEIKLY